MIGLSEKRPRICEVGIKIGEMDTGKYNAITDVKGVKVGHVSLIKDENVRTGVTAILPHDKNVYVHKVKAAVNIINGFGKAVGIPQIQELGEIETPILLTSTLNVWRVADALVDYMIETTPVEINSINPVVAECNDSFLNDIRGRHVDEKHVKKAINCAKSGPVEEGNVGAGVGMVAFGMKGGIGTASRIVPCEGEEYVIGSLVLTNFGRVEQLRINGIPVGKELKKEIETSIKTHNSVITVVATSAPLSYRQLKRVLNRVPYALARVGSISSHSSGDFAIGFVSSAEENQHIQDSSLTPFFQGVIEATEEAILNSLFKAKDMVGFKGRKVRAISVEKVLEIMEKFKFTIC